MTKELYWAYVGFTGNAGGKTRPVLYICQTGTDYVVFRLSSQYENKSAFIQSKYVEIKDWKHAGLTKRSWVDTMQTYHLPIDHTELTYIGQLTANDVERLIQQLDPN